MSMLTSKLNVKAYIFLTIAVRLSRPHLSSQDDRHTQSASPEQPSYEERDDGAIVSGIPIGWPCVGELDRDGTVLV